MEKVKWDIGTICAFGTILHSDTPLKGTPPHFQ